MTRFPPTPALRALRERFPAPGGPRVLIHRGTCGDAVGAATAGRALRASLGERAGLAVDAACDGACWAAPAATVVRERHVHRHARLDERGAAEVIACLDGDCDAERYAGAGQRGLTARLGRNDGSLGDVLAQGGYAALAHAIVSPPGGTIDALVATRLMGRGDGELPVAEAWKIALHHAGGKTLVVNAVDGAPGVFRNRHLLEGDPHRLIEGILLCCNATRIDRVTVCVDTHASAARDALAAALDDARAAGIADGAAFGHALDVTVVTIALGALSVVDGDDVGSEEAVRLDGGALKEHPLLAAAGEAVGDGAVLLQNAETLAAVTTVFDANPPPTRLVSLSGAVPRPGLYEVPVDGATTWAGVLAMAGANPYRVGAVRTAGADGTAVPPARFDAPLDPRRLGAGGAVALPPEGDA